MIDERDLHIAARFTWFAVPGPRTIYVQARVTKEMQILFPQKAVRLHRVILAADENVLVDHRDKNGLNCRRSNIRLATRTQNAAYRVDVARKSPYRGVTQDSRSGRWYAYIHFRNKQRKLGTFSTPEEAALAYNRAALAQFGEFAVLNTVQAKEGVAS